MKVKLFGEEIALVRPMGRRGVMYMQKALVVFQRMLNAMEPAQQRMTAKGVSELVVTAEAAKMVSEYIDDDFLNNVVPGLYMYSEEHLSLKDAQARIDNWKITLEGLIELFQAFVDAMNFWAKSEDQEAFDEATKKSPDVEVESEGVEKSAS